MLRSLSLLAATVAAIAGVEAASSDVIFWEQCGMDHPGNDIGSDKAKNPDACPFMCYTFDGCESVTWTNHEGGTCWYKRYNANPKPTANAVSFYTMHDVGPSNPQPNVYRYQCDSNVDMTGFDLMSTRGANIDICYGLCGLSNSCWAVVWTDYQGGTCWLKSRASAYVSRPGAQACILQRQLNDLTWGRCKP